MSNSPGVQSADGKFIPRLALLLFPAEEIDQQGSVVLHELAHADTFLGSTYYGAYATRALAKNDFGIQQDIVDFIEAVPSMLAELGGRHSPGTSPDERALALIRETVACYRFYFCEHWLAQQGLVPGETLPPAYLFDKTALMAIVRAALARAELDEQQATKHVPPLDVVADLLDRLRKMNGPKASADGFLDIDDHMEMLAFGSPFRINAMFGPQIQLLDVLMNTSEEHLTHHFILLSAISRLDFVMQAWHPHHTAASFFADQSNYHRLRLARWIHRVGGYPFRPGTLEAMVPLRFCFRPPVQDRQMVLPRRFSDPVEMERAVLLWHRYKVRKFFHALPGFIAWFVDRTMWQRQHHYTDVLTKLCDDAATSYLAEVEQRIAEWQGRACDNLAGTSDHHVKLVPVNDANGNRFLELVPT